MVEEGKPAPDFELPTDSGETVKLSELRGRPVVLYFYPKDDTAGCTAQACGIRDAYGEFEREGAVSGEVAAGVEGKVHPAGVVAVKVPLKDGETREIPFVVTWYTPRHWTTGGAEM